MGNRLIRRRGQRRIPLDLPCWLIVEDEIVCYRSFDISATGIAVKCSRPFPAGTIVELQIFLPTSAQPVSVTAKVIWSGEGEEGMMGLMFLEKDRRILDRLLALAMSEP